MGHSWTRISCRGDVTLYWQSYFWLLTCWLCRTLKRVLAESRLWQCIQPNNNKRRDKGWNSACNSVSSLANSSRFMRSKPVSWKQQECITAIIKLEKKNCVAIIYTLLQMLFLNEWNLINLYKSHWITLRQCRKSHSLISRPLFTWLRAPTKTCSRKCFPVLKHSK